MDPNEKLALYKTAELISVFNPLTCSSLIEISNELNISYYNTIKFRFYSLFHPIINRKIWVGFLSHVFTNHWENFPIVLLKILKGIEISLFALNLMQREKITISEVINALNRTLPILGFEIEIISPSGYIIQVIDTKMDSFREKDLLNLHTLLENNYPNVFLSLSGAYERFIKGGVNSNRQAIDSCRNAYENFFKEFTCNQNWKVGIKEKIPNSTICRLISDIYKLLSGLGTHSPIERSKEDVLLALRLTEAILVRVITD